MQMVLPIDQPCWQHDTTTVLEKDGYIYYSDTVGLTRPVKPLGFYMVISLHLSKNPMKLTRADPVFVRHKVCTIWGVLLREEKNGIHNIKIRK